MAAIRNSVLAKCWQAVLLAGLVGSCLLASAAASATDWHGSHDWFQRAGSLVVMLGGFIEYQYLRHLEGNATYRSVVEGELRGLPSEWLIRFHYCLVRLALPSIIGGTIVWGYGDLIF